MKKLLKIFCLTFLLSGLSGCTEEIDLDEINGPHSNRLVVEGSVTTLKTRQMVKLSRTGPAIINTTVDLAPHEKVSGAEVTINDGSNLFPLQEIDSLPGIYLTKDSIKGEVGKTYTLTIEVEGKQYQGSSTIVPATPFDPVEKLFSIPNRLQNPIYQNFEIFELEFGKVYYGVSAPSRQTLVSQNPVDSMLMSASFYEFPGIDPQGFLLNFAGDNEEIFFKEGATILQIKQSMTPEHYEYIRAMYDETHFRGGVYDRIPGNVPTNMSNGALGFFSASEVISREFVVTKELLELQQ